MENFLLLGILAGTFVFGFFAVKRVDRFLDNGQEPPEGELRVGYSDLRMTGKLSQVLGAYTRQHPQAPAELCYGTEEELLQTFSDGALEVLVLPAAAAIPEETEVHTCSLLLECTGFSTRDGVDVEPLAFGSTRVCIVWREKAAQAAMELLAHLQGQAVS